MSDDPGRGSFRRFFEHRIREGRASAAAWRVDHRQGAVTRGAVGWATLEPEREPVRPDSPFDLASLTKPLATALLLVLAEQRGEIDLESPLVETLPELRRGAYAESSWLDLGTHRAGLPAWRRFGPGPVRAEELLERIAGTEPVVAAGRELYSDLGYMVLGFGLERRFETPLARQFAERIAGPLGLARTGFGGDEGRFADAVATERTRAFESRLVGEDEPDDARPVRRGEVHDGNAHALGGAAGHAGLFGPVDEVAAIVRELLWPERLGLGTAARNRMLVRPPGSETRTFGFVTARGALAARGLLAAEAPGHVGFTGTSVWIEPRRGRLSILLANRVHPVVPDRGFDPVRRAFHRLVRRLGRD